MAAADQFILLAGALIAASIVAGRLSSRVGAPLLLVFLGLGMLVGVDGPGGLLFDDYETAYLVCSLALAIILFDGGLRTPQASLAVAVRPAFVLATFGVLVTAGITGAVAAWAMRLEPVEGLLVGAIVSSTDAAAVFLLLHQRGMTLKQPLGEVLEVESGMNDPMAIFLTLTCVGLINAVADSPSLAVLLDFVRQLGLGLAGGWLGGRALAWAVNRLEMAPGLYPIFALAGALTVFGGVQSLGGSGFLAVYLAGIIAGNSRLRGHRLIGRFHDGFAWLSQIVMFLTLGLLVTPSRLAPDLGDAALVAAALLLVARPVAVTLSLAPFRAFSWREIAFVSWVGLRGAVPIFLAIIPMLGNVTYALAIFNVAFLVVIASLVLQGWTVPLVARRLGVELPPAPEPAAGRTELDLLHEMDRDLVGYRLTRDSPAAARRIADLALPRRARIVAVLRDGALVPRAPDTILAPGDYVVVLSPPEQIFVVDGVLAARPA